MALSAGEMLGPYRVLAKIGQGGMGEVYKARDTRLDRDVAVKVLPEEWAQDESRRARFEREAKVIASLNHPHICTLYDIGNHNGAYYLVMEFIEGETLARRLANGRMSEGETLRIGAQIASALDKAHRQGVAHRDLKPGNIMLSKGSAKLLDFGLARQFIAPSPEATTQTLSADGAFVGTIPYMSPEQVQGKPAEARSDIFAFGAVLYEMLSGRRAFPSKDAASLIASILTEDPPALTTLGWGAKPPLERLVSRCMAKDADERWQSVADLRDEMLWQASGAGAAPPATGRSMAPWWLAAAAAACLLVGVLAWIGKPVPAGPPVQLAIVAPEDSEMSGNGSAISPDGKYVAFVATTAGRRYLWIRGLDQAKPYRLENSANALFPFWSPDSSAVAFFSYDKLKVVDLATRILRSTVVAGTGRGGTWGAGGLILFSPAMSSELMTVPATGGALRRATSFHKERKDNRHNFPQFLPGGNRFLVYVKSVDPSKTGTYAGTLGDLNLTPIRGLEGTSSQAIYAPSSSGRGYLLYVRERVLYAHPFSPDRLELEGKPSMLSLREMYASSTTPGFLNITLSNNGTLLDGGSHRSRNQLEWRDRDGKLLSVAIPGDEYMTPKLSADGGKVALTQVDSGTGDMHLWQFDFLRNSKQRFPFDRGGSHYPVWSPDGTRVAYSSDRLGNPNVHIRSGDGSDQPVPLHPNSSRNQFPFSWSADGKYIAYVELLSSASDRGGIWIAPVDTTAKAFPYLVTPQSESHPQFSPGVESRYVLYVSDETGAEQIYIRPFRGGPAPDIRWQVSQNGGSYPRWRADGKEIFFLAPDGKLMAADVELGANNVVAGAPRALFDARLPNAVGLRYEYDVSPDGRRFLLMGAAEQRPRSAIHVVLNWESLLRR